jgi:hypothetical protein
LKNREFALRVIGETHGQWSKLLNGETEGKIERSNTTQSKFQISSQEAKLVLGN